MKKKVLLFSFSLLMVLPTISTFAAATSKDITEASSAVTPEPVVGSIKEAMNDFNSLSRHEKKSRFKEMKKAIKDFKAERKAGGDVSTNTLLLVIISLFIPPLAVYLHEGEINNRFWISLLLTILGLILFGAIGSGILFLGTLPAIIYALIVVLGG